MTEPHHSKTLLVICTGNLFRSPMAAGLIRQELEQRGLADRVRIVSAGFEVPTPRPAPDRVRQQMLSAFGIDLGEHRSQLVEPELFWQADTILVMEEQHLTRLARQYPRFTKKIHRLSELGGTIYDIPDPAKDQSIDLAVLSTQIHDLVGQGFPKLIGWLGLDEKEVIHARAARQAVVAPPLQPEPQPAPIKPAVRIHPSADVSPNAVIGAGTQIWHQAQVREGVHIGANSILGKGVYVDAGVQIGANVKIQNYVSVFHGVTLEAGVFVGPHVCFTNDLRPRAINADGSPKAADDWTVSATLIKYGAALGANSTIVAGISVGRWAMVGAGSVVTRDVPDNGLVWGNPARLRDFVCHCGERLNIAAAALPEGSDPLEIPCSSCGEKVAIARADLERLQGRTES